MLFKVLARSRGILRLAPEIQFYRQREIHLLREPFQVIFREEPLQHGKGKPRQRQIQRHPFRQRRMLHLDSHLLTRFLERADMNLRKGRSANGL